MFKGILIGVLLGMSLGIPSGAITKGATEAEVGKAVLAMPKMSALLRGPDGEFVYTEFTEDLEMKTRGLGLDPVEAINNSKEVE